MTHRILLVEDDPVSRDLLASLLGTRGYIVDTADDGFGALRMAQDEVYDLVFVDYHLPEMDGYALARLMRTLGEKSDIKLKMVAMTADRFGLAARRGVDSIFDHVLAKPIEPDVLFTFVDECLVDSSPAKHELESFLAEPASHEAQNAAQVLWRVRGIETLPAAAVFPAPSAVERERLEYCFRIVDPDTADCLLLLRASGLGQIEALRASGRSYLQPLFTLDASAAGCADHVFQIGDAESWSAAAACLNRFGDRRRELKAEAVGAKALEARLAAYLFVAARCLVLTRDRLGRTSVPYTGGFAAEAVIEAVKALAGQGFVTARPNTDTRDGVRELCVDLTPKGIQFVADRIVTSASAG